MRGEHVSRLGSKPIRLGSSPHARGARSWQPSSYLLHRIIPACAGSTFEANLPNYFPRDHPRMRGEHGPRLQ